MKVFLEALALVFKHEGIYSDHPYDSGGATKFGITQKVAKQFGYKDDMKEFPIHLAQQIYKEKYWDIVSLDLVAKIHPDVAIECFECGVNMGPRAAVKFLQEALNCLNTDLRFRNLLTDGNIGKKTIRELSRIPNKDVPVLVKIQNSLQGARYVKLSQKNRKLKVFMRGWFNRVML